MDLYQQVVIECLAIRLNAEIQHNRHLRFCYYSYWKFHSVCQEYNELHDYTLRRIVLEQYWIICLTAFWRVYHAKFKIPNLLIFTTHDVFNFVSSRVCNKNEHKVFLPERKLEIRIINSLTVIVSMLLTCLCQMKFGSRAQI